MKMKNNRHHCRDNLDLSAIFRFHQRGLYGLYRRVTTFTRIQALFVAIKIIIFIRQKNRRIKVLGFIAPVFQYKR